MKHIALVKDGEPFPVECRPYSLRVGNLAAELAGRGHQVTWHASTFSHYKREFLTSEQVNAQGQAFQIELHQAGAYRKNVSPARWMHHVRLALAEYRTLLKEPKLDLIFCCVPTLESALACLLVSRLRGVPVLLDIRDPWPEAFALAAPKRWRPLVRTLLFPYFQLAYGLFRHCTGLTAVSQSFLDWAQKSSGRANHRKEMDAVFYHGCHDLRSDAPVESSEGPLRVVYLGGFSTIYEFETLKRALQNGLGNSQEVEFILVGQGGDNYHKLRSEFQQYDNLHMPGWLPREEAYRLASTCHIGLIPLKASHSHFLPNKPFEYASLGLGLLTCAEGEVRHLVESHECGWHYREGDPDSLQAILSRLGREPEVLQLARRKARQFWEQQGDARLIARQLADHLLRLGGAGKMGSS